MAGGWEGAKTWAGPGSLRTGLENTGNIYKSHYVALSGLLWSFLGTELCVSLHHSCHYLP